MGLDCSTKSIAYAIIDNGDLVDYGEIHFVGRTPLHRAADARNKVQSLKAISPDAICIEKTIMVRSIETAISMAYVAGSVMSELIGPNTEFRQITPIFWQSAIGNKNLTASEKNSIKAEFPGKSKTWYDAKNRSIRKARTITWVKNEFGIDVASDNIADAIGISWVGYSKLL